MTETNQILLSAVIVVLTILMVIVGWQIFQILSEIRKMLMKFNKMVDGAVTVTGNLGKSFENMSGFSEGVKSVFSLFRLFRVREKKDKDED